jgi:hypothetical protein
MGLGNGKGGQPPQEEAGASAQPARRRKPYQKPAFRFERVFETQALTCGKTHMQGGTCHLNHKTS